MSFIFPNIPTIRSKSTDLTDYMEILCLQRNDTVSVMDLQRRLMIASDELLVLGIDSEEDTLESKFETIMSEIQRRNNNCRGNYPFIDTFSTINIKSEPSLAEKIYLYLLLATRINMQANRMFEDIDGTLLFEELSTIVTESYFGNRAQAINLGTSKKGITFEDRINNLISLINEGGFYRTKIDANIYEKDGKLDLAVCKSFTDKQPSKLIGFGQCKTGVSWENHKTELQPSNYCKKWFHDQPSLDPIGMFFIADVEEPSRFYNIAVDTGLFFDRCRIIDYLPDTFDSDLCERIDTWTNAAIKYIRRI